MFPFLGSVITNDVVHALGHSPVCHMLLHIIVRKSISDSPPALISSPGMLSTPADFHLFSDLVAASTSVLSIGRLSSSSMDVKFSTVGSPLAS